MIIIIIIITKNATALGERKQDFHRRFCQSIEPVMFVHCGAKTSSKQKQH